MNFFILTNIVLIIMFSCPNSAISNHQNLKQTILNRQFKTWSDVSGNSIAISNAVLTLNSAAEKSGFPRLKNKVSRSRKKRATKLTSTEMEEILSRHNELRKHEGASDMRYMIWNTELADMAQQWADGCDFVHGQPGSHSTYGTSIGQNLFMTTAASISNWTSTVQAWFDEKSNYDYATKGCSGVCGHYTQVVWASSFELGCGYKTCQPLQDSDSGTSHPTGTQLVCNYGPAGNYAGASPYTLGPACTLCETGVFNCFDNMCVDDCTGVACECKADVACQNCASVTSDCSCSCADGWTGVGCTAECADTDSRCNNGWYSAWCNSNYQYVLDGCPAMCNLCTETANPLVCENTTSSGGSIDTTSTTVDAAADTTVQTTVHTTTISTETSTALQNGVSVESSLSAQQSGTENSATPLNNRLNPISLIVNTVLIMVVRY